MYVASESHGGVGVFFANVDSFRRVSIQRFGLFAAFQAGVRGLVVRQQKNSKCKYHIDIFNDDFFFFVYFDELRAFSLI